MHLSYLDESGDDGYPKYSSELFVLSSIYFHSDLWKAHFRAIRQFRERLKEKWGLPIKVEFHSSEFIRDKDPYHGMYTPTERRAILFEYCAFVASLEFKIISVVINKTKINRPKYDVLKNAVTYNIQRIENDFNKSGHDGNFMIITDEGRIKMMRDTTRSIQKINYIPSKFGPDPYRKEIARLVEDPLPKPSSESYFIQIADLVSFLVGLFTKQNLCNPKQKWSNRVSKVLSGGDETTLLDLLKPRFNLYASKSPYGIVFYPK